MYPLVFCQLSVLGLSATGSASVWLDVSHIRSTGKASGTPILSCDKALETTSPQAAAKGVMPDNETGSGVGQLNFFKFPVCAFLLKENAS